MSRFEPQRQLNWDWRAAGNFIGGGSGGGLAVAAAIASLDGVVFWPFGLVALALVAGGLLCVWAEIGRPWRALHVFFHPQTSWMTRESYVALPLLALGLLAAGLSAAGRPGEGLALYAIWITAGLAVLYLWCQARILRRSKGIPAWRHPAIELLIIVTGLTEGAGLMAAAMPLLDRPLPGMVLILIGLCLLRGWAWRRYLARLAADGAPSGAVRALRRIDAPSLWLGHLAPAALLAAALLAGVAAGAAPWLSAAAGLLAVGGGWSLKFTIVTRAAYDQGFALPTLPVRGGGTAGAATKPGWS